MAVLGVQLVVTLFTATLMHRLAPHCSFARWLLCSGSLFRYKHPSEEELRALAGRQRPRGRRERWAHGLDDEKPLSVPRDAPFQLQTCPLTAVDALVLRFFLEYQWFVDFAVYSGGVYVFTELYYYVLGPAKEANIALFWCLLTVAFSQDVPDGDPAVLQRRGGRGALGLPRLRLPVPHAGHAGAGGAGGDPGAGPGARPGQHDPELGAASAGPRLGLGTPRGQAGHPRGAGGRGVRAGRLPHLPRAATGSDPQGRAHHVGAPAAAAVAAAHQLPVPRDHLVALDPAHRAGLPAAGAPRRGVRLPAVGRGLRLGAPLGAGGAVPAAPGRHAAPPAGLPVPGQSPRGAAAQGGRPHRGPRDPAAGGPRVLLRDGGEPAVPDAAHPHAQLHAAAQVLRWLLLGPGPRPSAVPGPARPQRRAARPGGRRGPGDGGAHRGRPGRAALAAPPPRAPGLPHLVDGGLPAAVQPLRPLLPPAPGRLLAACSPAARPSALARLGACPRLQHRAGACAVHRSA